MSEQNNTMEKFLQYLEKLNTRLDKLEDLLEISEDGQKRKQDRINAQKAISLKNQQKVKANNAIYPLTECGVIPYPIAVGNTTTPIPLNSVDNSPNQVDGFPAKFAMSLEDGSGLPVTSAQINACLYTATLASVWFTTGQKPSWQQSVLDRNGGYNKGATIEEYEYLGVDIYVVYKSLIPTNINPRPTLASHVGWIIESTSRSIPLRNDSNAVLNIKYCGMNEVEIYGVGYLAVKNNYFYINLGIPNSHIDLNKPYYVDGNLRQEEEGADSTKDENYITIVEASKLKDNGTTVAITCSQRANSTDILPLNIFIKGTLI